MLPFTDLFRFFAYAQNDIFGSLCSFLAAGAWSLLFGPSRRRPLRYGRPSGRRIDCPFGHNRSLRGVSHVNRPSRRRPLQARCGRRTSKACPYTFHFPLSTFNSLLPPRSPIAYCLTLYCLLTFHFPLSTSRCLSRTSKACPYTFRFPLSTFNSLFPPRSPIAYCLIPIALTLSTFRFQLSTAA